MKKKRLSAIFMALALCVSLSATTACSASDNGEKPGSGIDAPGGNTGDDGNAGGGTVPPDGGKTNKNALNKVANFSTGFTSADGGVAEIVKYNEDNGKFYLVNGKTQTLDIVTLRTLADDKTQLETVFTEETDRISFDSLTADHPDDFADGFAVGDITSVAINEDSDIIAVALQAKDYDGAGAVVLLNYDGSFIKAYPCGVQPDMVTFSGNLILTADEGEPRLGYGEGCVDPKGSVTVIDLSSGIDNGNAVVVTFDEFDAERDELTESGVILKKGAAPSADLEPEYIATAGKYAYVSLQEANAIATLDPESKKFTSVLPLGFKDHSVAGNEIDLLDDGKAEIKNQNVYGVYMPDGIDAFEVNGETYLITANEGDAREWGDYSGVKKTKIEGTKAETPDNEKWDGIDADKTYILGGRSFAIFKASDMTLVYESGAMIESAVAESEFKEHFNCSNDDVELDSRSKKKGPEPESVKVAEIDGKRYAFVGLERTGGVMMFDITDFLKGKAALSAYANSRDYSLPMAGDVAPEGLDFLPAEKSPTGKALLFVANENSGTVSVYALEEETKTYRMHETFVPAPDDGDRGKTGSSTLVIYSVYGSGGNTDGTVSHNFIAIKNISENEIDLTGYTVSYSENSTDLAEKSLSGSIAAGEVYIIRCAAANTTSAVINIADNRTNAEWSDLSIDNKTFSLKLTFNDTVVDALAVDAKGGSAVAGEGTPVNDMSKQKIIIRKGADTDDNSADFEAVSFKGEAQGSEKAITYMKKLGLE